MVKENAYILLFISIFAYANCLFFTAFDTDLRGTRNGLALLEVGWLGFMMGDFSWWANPLILLSWIGFGANKPKFAVITSALAVLLILTFTLHTTVILGEDGVPAKILGYGAGYWLWLASAFIMLICSLSKSVKPAQEEIA